MNASRIKTTAANPSPYVSRAALKLESVSKALNLNFTDKIVLDVGSSTGGFTDYALAQGAAKVLAVELGTKQMHPKLRGNPKLELHEQTDIREFAALNAEKLNGLIDIILIDVSFVSLSDILPSILRLTAKDTEVIAMLKPQFEARTDQKNRGVVKNERIRREIIKDFENRIRPLFLIEAKADSQVSGAKGNIERFYKLRKLAAS